ncbi:MAG: AraC family transcriptional regulator [Paenibacillus sp.]|nr:AraC family transcriptional regulator [Paenibacillus sp.]
MSGQADLTPASPYIAKLSEIRPVVNFANRLIARPGQNWGPRTIPDCQFIFVISGQATIKLGPQTYRISSGECVFYGANSPHQIISSQTDPVTFSSIHFSWDQESAKPVHPVAEIRDCEERELEMKPAAYAVQMDGFGEVQVPHYFVQPALEPLFLQIADEYGNAGYGYEASLRGLLLHLIVTIVRQHLVTGLPSSPDQMRKITPALEAIRSGPDANWTTDELARLCGYHPTYFAALFRQTTGASPKHFVVLERIRRAKQLLLEDCTIEQTADKLGYTSIHYFCRNFKEATGLTPTEFKRQMKVL